MTIPTQARPPEEPETPTTEPEPTTPAAEAPEPTRVRPPTFRKIRESLRPPGSPDAATDGGSDAGGDSAAKSGPQLGQPQTKSGGSRTSSRADRKALREAVAIAFSGITTLAHEFLVHDRYAKFTGVLLADEQDLEAIAEPGGNIAARRMPDSELGGELADGIGLLIGLVGYGLKQLGKLRIARQLREEGAAIGVAGGLQPNLGGPADQEDADEPADPSYAAPGV